MTVVPLPDRPDFVSHARFVALALAFLDREGRAVPAGIVTPPIAGVCALPGCTTDVHSHCVHCGSVVPERQGLRWHTPAFTAGDGRAATIFDGEQLVQLIVAHCPTCQDGAACAGACEPFDEEEPDGAQP